MTEKKILYNSDEAATYVTNIKGWISARGFFYGDEPGAQGTARYDGCTHRICSCGREMTKNWTLCDECREQKAIKKYNAMEKEVWDGEALIYSDTNDKYFHSIDEIDEYCDEEKCTIASLRLLICEPNHLRQIDEDYCFDDMPDDSYLPDAVSDAIDAFNKVITEQDPISWHPGKTACIFKKEE